jgi:DNA-binding GntR family transcriptional regulator
VPGSDEIDPAGPDYAYVQLARVLAARIERGDWNTGPLPSVKALQQEYETGRDTVLRAIEQLRKQGLVFTIPKRGTYVAQGK